jgi:ATP-dependent DNA ligase
MTDATFSIPPPVEPMLAKLADAVPETGRFLFEPKWDGFRSIIFRRGSDLFMQSRDLRPLDRYFPELHDALLAGLPPDCVVDGEIVIATPHGLDFDALQMRLHPAASRVAKLAQSTPASFVAFDLLALDGVDLRSLAMAERRQRLEAALAGSAPPLHLTPMTRDRAIALDWLSRFEGAGLDGVIAKPDDSAYEPGKRTMIKIKHARTADCVVAGFRWHKDGKDTLVARVTNGGSWSKSSRRSASARSTSIPGANGPRPVSTRPRACRAARADGARGRISHGSRSAPSVSAK